MRSLTQLALRRYRQVIDFPAMVRSFRAETAQRAADPPNLRNFEEKVFSQNGEDGNMRIPGTNCSAACRTAGSSRT